LKGLQDVILIEEKFSSWNEMGIEVNLVLFDKFSQQQLYVIFCGGDNVSILDIESWVVLTWLIFKEFTDVCNIIMQADIVLVAFDCILQMIVFRF
jgi:hypothetical protein